ncbi:MAG: hypothetical protein ABSF46_16305 [Terriglobia bacterium]|jgi:hypothetical protein
MKKKLPESAKVILALAIIGGVGYGVYALIRSGLAWLASVRSELATAIIAAAGAVLVSVLSVSIAKFLERRETIERETRLKKIPVYESLISLIFGILQQDKPGIAKLTGEELIRKFSALTENVIVWGSDSVLKRFGEFRVASLQVGQGQGLINALATLEDLMLAIRRDLGYKNAKIERGDLLRLFINDLDQHREALKLLKR